MTESMQHCSAVAADVAICGYSPVSYFEPGRAELGDPKFAVSHNGKTYHLTSEKQASAFRASPETYLPAHEGACAYGASKGQLFPVDPKSFKIVDGRLLLFLRNDEVDARALWEKAQAEQCAADSCNTC